MKIYLKKNWWWLLTLIIALIFIDINAMYNPIKNIESTFKQGQFFYRYVTKHSGLWIRIVTWLKENWLLIIEWLKSFNLNQFLLSIIDFLYNTLVALVDYVLNFLMLFYIILYNFLNKECYEVKVTKGARRIHKYFKFKKRVLVYIKKLFKYIWFQRKKIILCLVIFLFFRGWLVNFLVEVLIFIAHYVIASINLVTHKLLSTILQSIVIFIVFEVPIYINIFALLMMFWTFAVRQGENRLESNMSDLKAIDKFEMHFANGIVGEPGTGKTESSVALSLANEENNIDEIEEQLHLIEMSHPKENWAIYDPMYEHYDQYTHVVKYPEHYFFTFLLHESNSMIASAPFAINDPYKEKCSVVLDLDWIRPSVLAETFPFEEYKCLVIDELDKEYNSHYSTKEVGEDGMYRFIGTGAHWFRRNGKVYATWQIFSQVPLNIRGNMEKLVRVRERVHRFPFLLGVFMSPFRWLFMWIDNMIMKYESYKPRLAKHTRRKGLRIRKRYDYTWFYAFLRHHILNLVTVLDWFEKFRYIVLKCEIIDVNGNQIGKMKIPINKQDEEWDGERLYDSTHLSVGYEKKHKRTKNFWDTLKHWSSVKPEAEELKLCHSRFINETVFDTSGRDAEHKTAVSSEVATQPQTKQHENDNLPEFGD